MTTRLPGTLGGIAPPAGDDVQHQIRNLQQQISDLVTARTIQSSETSAVVPRSYNGSTDGLTFPGGATRTFAHEGGVVAPITCSQVLVHVVATAGDTGGGDLFISIYIVSDNENPGDPGTVSEEIATAVSTFASGSMSFARVMPGMSAGATIGMGVMVGTASAGNAGAGNGHLSATLLFIR